MSRLRLRYVHVASGSRTLSAHCLQYNLGTFTSGCDVIAKEVRYVLGGLINYNVHRSRRGRRRSGGGRGGDDTMVGGWGLVTSCVFGARVVSRVTTGGTITADRSEVLFGISASWRYTFCIVVVSRESPNSNARRICLRSRVWNRLRLRTGSRLWKFAVDVEIWGSLGLEKKNYLLTKIEHLWNE